MQLCFLSCRRFEDNVHFLICYNSVQNLVIGWRLLHWFQSWLPEWVTYITTLPSDALLTLSVSIGLVSLSVRVISVKFTKPLSLTDRQTSGPIDWPQGTPGWPRLGPIKMVSPHCGKICASSGQWIWWNFPQLSQSCKVDYQDESLTLPLCLVMPYWPLWNFFENSSVLVVWGFPYQLVLSWYLWVTYITTLPCNVLLTLSVSIDLVSLSHLHYHFAL